MSFDIARLKHMISVRMSIVRDKARGNVYPVEYVEGETESLLEVMRMISIIEYTGDNQMQTIKITGNGGLQFDYVNLPSAPFIY